MDIKYKLIDVSAHNGTIDFAKVKTDGVQGVIIRAGYGFKTVDKCFKNNIKNALANGLQSVHILDSMASGSTVQKLTRLIVKRSVVFHRQRWIKTTVI